MKEPFLYVVPPGSTVKVNGRLLKRVGHITKHGTKRVFRTLGLGR